MNMIDNVSVSDFFRFASETEHKEYIVVWDYVWWMAMIFNFQLNAIHSLHMEILYINSRNSFNVPVSHWMNCIWSSAINNLRLIDLVLSLDSNEEIFRVNGSPSRTTSIR